MKVKDPVLIQSPTGHMAFAVEIRFDPGEAAQLQRAKPGESLLAIIRGGLQSGVGEVLAKGAKVEETESKLSRGEIEAGAAKEAFA